MGAVSTAILSEIERLGATGPLRLEAWPDPVIDELGHDPRSDYVERFWLPVLGPSTVFLLRHLARRLEQEPAGTELCLDELAAALGLGARPGRNSPFSRTLARAVDFEMARLHPGCLYVRRALPTLAHRHLARLPDSLRAEHARAVLAARSPRRPSHRLQLERRARQLALSLRELGEPAEAIAGHLERWRFEPSAVAAAVAFVAGRSGAASAEDERRFEAAGNLPRATAL